jgi:hypothetical protein
MAFGPKANISTKPLLPQCSKKQGSRHRDIEAGETLRMFGSGLFRLDPLLIG